MKIKLLFALIFLFGLSAFSEGFCCSDKTGSTSKFAPENFFGGIYANLKSLRADKVYQTLPIDQLTYTDIFVERFDADVVRELALFAGVNQNASRPDLPFELAAAARLTAPASIEQVFTSWQASANIPITFDDSGIEPVAIEGRDCFRCPTGTFLSSRNLRGTFQWRERSGKALTNGINVGSAGPRRYLNGRDAGCELAVLFELQPEDFADGKLKFVFEPEIFRTVDRKYHPHLNLHFYLQKPSSDGRIRTCSKVAAVELVSKVQSEVTFEDSTVGNSDGISAFVADGKLELVVAFENKSTYVGFAPSDIELVQDEHEWVFLDEENFVVAQSRSRLIEMISGQGKEQSNKLASELTPMDREEVRIYADLKNQAELIACNELLTHLSVPLNGDVIQIKDACEINAAVSLADPHLVKANFRFANSDHAESAAETIKQWQQVLRIRAAEHLVEFALTERKLRSLAGYAMLGDSNWTIASRELEDLLAENELTKSVVEDLVGGLFVAKSAFGNQVSLSFAMPSWFAKSTPQQLHALQLIKLQRARECHQLGKHNLHSKLLRKAIAQTPKDRELWKSAAHQLSYNVAAEFDSVEIKYQWVRQGILLSLDGYEHEPTHVGLLWNAAMFVGHKIGSSDERKLFRKLFSEDKALLARLTPYCNSEKTKRADGTVDNWLVARQLAEYCEKEVVAGRKQRDLPKNRCLSFHAECLLGFAESMDKEAILEGRTKRWRSVEVAIESIAETPDIKFLRPGAIHANWHVLLAKIQQQEWATQIHQTMLSARQCETKRDRESAIQLLEAAMDELATQLKTNSKDFVPAPEDGSIEELFQDAFPDLISRYQKSMSNLGKKAPERYEQLLPKRRN